jgi:FkbM family methyltransferase
MNAAQKTVRIIPPRLRARGRDWLETQISKTPPAILKRRSSQLRLDLDMVLSHYRVTHPQVRYLQVGAFDGVSGDPIHPLIERHGLQGILIEPQKDVFERLKANYARFPNFRLVNAAISDHDGSSTLFRTKPGTGPEWLGQIASFNRDVLMWHSRKLSNLDLESLIESEQVRCVTFDTLFKEEGISKIDLLQIDAEGFDAEILRLFDIPLRRPAIVHFEHIHLSVEDHEKTIGLLVGQGYRVTASGTDTLAYLQE